MIYLLLLLVFLPLMSYASAESNVVLYLQPLAPKLPADNGKYFIIMQLQTADGKPTYAPYDIEITLTSSRPDIATVRDKVTLRKGDNLVNVELYTTNKSGSTTIHAIAPNITTGSTTVETVRLGGKPTKLALYAHTNFIADPNIEGKLYIQLLDTNNLPVSTTQPITVNIISKDVNIIKTIDKVTINKGESGTFVDYKIGTKTGSTMIIAKAPSLEHATLIINTAERVGNKLALDIAPSIIPAAKGTPVILTIQMLDENDIPAKSFMDVEISLTSSDLDAIKVPSKVVLKAGQYYIHTIAEIQGKVTDNATISAFAYGYKPALLTIKTVTPLNDSINCKNINLHLTPSKLLADNSRHAIIVAQLLDGEQPCLQNKEVNIGILLSTADSQIGKIDSMVNIPYNKYYGIAEFTTTFASGSTIITATKDNYNPTQASLDIIGANPTSIALNMPYLINTDNRLMVHVVDENNRIIKAPHDISIRLTSSDTSILTMDQEVTIPAGESYATATLNILKEGHITITASSDGLHSQTIEANIISNKPRLAIYAMPSIIADGGKHNIIVQLQDADGNPLVAAYDILIHLSSSMKDTFVSNTIIKKGNTYAIAEFTASAYEGDTIITASSDGFESAYANLSLILQQLNYEIQGIPDVMHDLNDTRIKIRLSYNDMPVDNAVVKIIDFNGEFSCITQYEGCEIVYKPAMVGSNTITIIANKEGYKTISESFDIYVDKSPKIVVKAITLSGKDVIGDINLIVRSSYSEFNTQIHNGNSIIEDVKPDLYEVHIDEYIDTYTSFYKFERWSDGVSNNTRYIKITDDKELIAIYSARHVLQLNSEYGVVYGNGVYEEGSKAYFGIEENNVPIYSLFNVQLSSMEDVFNYVKRAAAIVWDMLVEKRFVGWEGDIYSTDKYVEIIIDSPKYITAKWNINYNNLFIISGAGIGVTTFLVYKVIRRANTNKELELFD